MKTATTVTKLCRVMEQLQGHESFGITDLARRTDLLPSDVHRLLASLRIRGYIEQDPETRRYRLGFSLLRLAAFHRDELCQKAHPVLARLARRIGATTRLALLDQRDLKVFLVDRVAGPIDLVHEDHVGRSEPLHCTALGKAAIANLSDDIVFSALEKTGLPRRTHRTITDEFTLKQQLEGVRRLGYAIDFEEAVRGICCLAVPLTNSCGAVVGAISASMPSQQFVAWDEALLATHLKTAALRVSATLSASLSVVDRPSML